MLLYKYNVQCTGKAYNTEASSMVSTKCYFLLLMKVNICLAHA